MKKNVFKIGILSLAIFAASTVYAQTHCNSGDKGLCVNASEGGKACTRINPEVIGDCGGTSVDEDVNPEIAP